MNAKEWWDHRRLRYNIGLVIAGLTAYIIYIVLAEYFIAPYVREYEWNLLYMGVQGIMYLGMIAIANVCYNLGHFVDRNFNKKNSEKFRSRLFTLGFCFSVGLPFLVPAFVMMSYTVFYAGKPEYMWRNGAEDYTVSTVALSSYSHSKDFFERSPDGEKTQRWISTKCNDSIGCITSMKFCDQYAIIEYSGQCMYYYFTYRTSDTTRVLLWSNVNDCVHDMNVLKQSHGVKKRPKTEDIFATYSLVNDSCIVVKYAFREWTRKVNVKNSEAIFPDTLITLKR